MGFRRAQWHSGLTYKQTCLECKTTVTYDDYKLDFRPWFADGFVYCPKCQKPLRHNESFAINNEQKEEVVVDMVNKETKEIFCSQCGNKFSENDKFCSQCGKKREIYE